MRLSVIIPCYNAAETIDELLESLAIQQWNYPWEVIVADNGSSDESVEVVKKYKRKISSLRIIDASKKKGASYARNLGVKFSSGEYIAFIDADDVASEKWIKNIGNSLFTYDLVACKLDWVTLNSLSDNILQVKPQKKGLIEFGMGKFLPFANGGTLGVKKSAHNKIGGFDESIKYVEDTDYCWRLQLEGYKLMFIPEAVIHMRARSTNKRVLIQHMRWGEHHVYLYEKYRRLGIDDCTIKQSIKSLYHVLLAWKDLFSSEKRELWIIRFGLQFGRLKGMVKYQLIKRRLINRELEETIFSTSKHSH